MAMGAVVVVAGAVALGIGTSGESTGSSARGRDAPPTPLNAQPAAGPRWAADQAFGATAYFLAHYELPNGRVVRWDQGADTVSEGEAYAMLLSVAAGDRRRFDAAWYWTRAHLRQPDGLLAWHWANGAITSSEPAADADVDTAYALELASTRLHEPGDLAAAEAMASAIAGNETASSPTGRVLAAGPWAVGPPAYVDPSYASPSELGSLARLPGEAQSYAALAAGTRALVEQDMGPDTLPPDWVQVTGSAPVDVAPQGNRADDRYGFDAVRVPIRWGASCNSSDRQAVAALWPVLGPAALRGHATVDLGLRRGEDQGRGAVRSPVGLVAAAASGWAAGHRDRALALLSRAEALDRARPTYYSSAWVALGRVFFETSRLGTCPAWST